MCFSRIIEIKAFSHQGYPITYELATESGAQSNEFAIDQSTGVVDLLRTLDYEKDPQQYHLRVKVIENGRPTRTSVVNVSSSWNRCFMRECNDLRPIEIILSKTNLETLKNIEEISN